MTVKGIRNNNPGNIRHGNKWEGLAEKQEDIAFCTFKTPEYGIRALAKLLKNYQSKYGLNTVYKIINRFAPPNENDTTSYIKSVCRVLDVEPNTIINVNDTYILLPLIRAIIRRENGTQPYSNETILKGISLC